MSLAYIFWILLSSIRSVKTIKYAVFVEKLTSVLVVLLEVIFFYLIFICLNVKKYILQNNQANLDQVLTKEAEHLFEEKR